MNNKLFCKFHLTDGCKYKIGENIYFHSNGYIKKWEWYDTSIQKNIPFCTIEYNEDRTYLKQNGGAVVKTIYNQNNKELEVFCIQPPYLIGKATLNTLNRNNKVTYSIRDKYFNK